MRLSDKVTIDDVERTINIVMTSLKQVGMDKDTGKLDIDILTVGVGKAQRERIKDLKNVIMELAREYRLRRSAAGQDRRKGRRAWAI